MMTATTTQNNRFLRIDALCARVCQSGMNMLNARENKNQRLNEWMEMWVEEQHRVEPFLTSGVWTQNSKKNSSNKCRKERRAKRAWSHLCPFRVRKHSTHTHTYRKSSFYSQLNRLRKITHSLTSIWTSVLSLFICLHTHDTKSNESCCVVCAHSRFSSGLLTFIDRGPKNGSLSPNKNAAVFFISPNLFCFQQINVDKKFESIRSMVVPVNSILPVDICDSSRYVFGEAMAQHSIFKANGI